VKKAVPVILFMSVLSLLVPALILKTFASSCCQLEVITNVPMAEIPGGIKVTVNGGATEYSLNYTATFAEGSEGNITLVTTSFIGAVNGERYTFEQWTYTGNGELWSPTPTMVTPYMETNYTSATCSGGQNCPFLAEFTVAPPLGCKTDCNLEALTNVPSADGTIWVRVNGVTVKSLATTLSFPNGTVNTIQVLNNTFTGASSGAKYVWEEWSCTCSVSATTNQTLTTPPMYYNYTTSGSGAFTALFEKQYPLTLTFTDQQGNVLSPPASIQLASGSSTVNLSSYSGVYESALVWNVENVTWQGIPEIQAQGQTVDLTGGSASVTIKLDVFSATVKAVDGSNNPISGVNVTVSYANSTTRSFLTNSQGLAQLGDMPLPNCVSTCDFTAVVTYQGATSPWSCSVNAANPSSNVCVVQVSAGGSSGTTNTPLVSAIVILAIFGVAAFLVLLAIKVRKPPTPPQIQ
jgi:hypothetical protein